MSKTLRDEIVGLATDAIATARAYEGEPIAEQLTDEVLTLLRERVEKARLTSEDMNGLHRETRDAQLNKVLEVLQ